MPSACYFFFCRDDVMLLYVMYVFRGLLSLSKVPKIV